MRGFREQMWLFGVPVDAITLEEAVEAIMAFAGSREETSGPRLVTTVNTDFLANVLPWFGPTARHPELIRILRRSDLSTADGMPLVWAARLLGGRLPGRVTGADLVPRLAGEAARRRLSVYLFGGNTETANETARRFREQHPDLRIAGVDSPFVSTTGADLGTAFEADAPICERINRASPDILFIAFGNPKQELWFARNRHRLNVGVAIGIGGTFDFIAGRRDRAPQWMQDNGLEWVFRMLQEPRRLCRRYLVDFLKIGWRTALLSTQYRCGRMRQWFAHHPRAPGQPLVTCFFAGSRVINLFNLSSADLDEGRQLFLQTMKQPDLEGAMVLECKQLDELSTVQTATLIRGWQLARANGWPTFLTDVRRRFHRSLAAHRAWDIVAPYVCHKPDETVTRLTECWPEERGYIALERYSDRLEIKVFGRLEAEDVVRIDAEALDEQFSRQPCLVDLDLCFTIDSTGVGFLSRLHAACEGNGKPFCIAGTCPETHNMIRAAELHRVLRVIPDIETARRTLGADAAAPVPA